MKYSVESLEFLKEKSTITYDEAVELLKKYDGDVALAIVELEKQGKLKPEMKKKAAKMTKTKGKEKKKLDGLNQVFRKLMAHRLVIKKDDIIIANISWLFIIISVCTAPWLVVFSFIASMFLGYKYSRTVNWSLAGDEIKDFGQKTVANFKDFTNRVLENEPAVEKEHVSPKTKVKVNQVEANESVIKEAEKLANEVIEKEKESLTISEIIIEP